MQLLTLRNALISAAFFVFFLLTSSWNRLSTPTSTKLSFFQNDEHALQQSMCGIHSNLFKDVENTEKYWRTVGGMSRDDLEKTRHVCERDGNCASLKVWDGELYIRTPITKELGFQSRTHSMLLMLLETDFSGVPDVDFVVNSNDGVRTGEACFMEMDKHVSERDSQSLEQYNHFLLPDFSMFEWYEAGLPPFSHARKHLAEEAGPFYNKTPKLFYRGNLDLQQGTQRTDLVVKLGPETDIADVKAIDGVGDKKNFKTIWEICSYKYVIYTEGFTYSGRLKYTALCNSVNLGHKITFVEFWTHLIDPYYVVVKDWDDAVKKYRDFEAHPKKAEALASGMVATLRNALTPQAVECYVHRAVEGFANSINWEVMSPKEDIRGKDAKGKVVTTFEWVPIEKFVVKSFWKGVGPKSPWTNLPEKSGKST